jgi:redox-sensing transcriptional repressor
MKAAIPLPTVDRLCLLFYYLEELLARGQRRVSSSRLAEALGIGAHSIRRDISCLGEVGDTGAGYPVARLRDHIAQKLGLNRPQKTCVVGLGRLGSAILAYGPLGESGFDIVAGFDTNINRIETIRTSVPVYPAYEMGDIVRREGIRLAVLAVPPAAAQESVEHLVDAGVRGVVNFTPAVIRYDRGTVYVRHMDVRQELAVLTAQMGLESQ